MLHGEKICLSTKWFVVESAKSIGCERVAGACERVALQDLEDHNQQ